MLLYSGPSDATGSIKSILSPSVIPMLRPSRTDNANLAGVVVSFRAGQAPVAHALQPQHIADEGVE